MKHVGNAIVLTEEEYAALKRKQSPKLCCSKKVLLMSWSTTVFLTLIALLAFFLAEKDVTPLETLAGLSWGVTAAVTAVYSWKAKAENKIKLTNIMVKDLADKYGIDAVVSLLGITLAD